MKRWSPEEDAVLRRLYPVTQAAEMAPMLGRSVAAINCRANRIKVRAAPQRVAESNRSARASVTSMSESEMVAWLTENVRIDEDGCLRWAGGSVGRPRSPAITWRGKLHRARRLLAQLLGKVKADRQRVWTSCGKNDCMKPEHLRTGTRSEMTRDMVAAGRYPSGRQHALAVAVRKAPTAKLPITELENVKRMRGQGMTLKQIGEHYGVGFQRVHGAIKSWTRATGGWLR